MGLLNALKSKQFEKSFEKALERELSKSRSENEIYNEITKCYVMLLSLLNVNNFNSFQFADYKDCRRILVDGNEYDFDNKFNHNDNNAAEMLCNIDCLISDLEDDDLEEILKTIERKINSGLSQ